MSEEPERVEDLPPAELAALGELVRGLVEHDEEVLRRCGATADGQDPYIWTRDWADGGDVHLVMPPALVGDVYPFPDGSGLALDVDMWTEEEGLSDLTLQVTLRRTSDGAVVTTFEGLHVL